MLLPFYRLTKFTTGIFHMRAFSCKSAILVSHHHVRKNQNFFVCRCRNGLPTKLPRLRDWQICSGFNSKGKNMQLFDCLHIREDFARYFGLPAHTTPYQLF